MIIKATIPFFRKKILAEEGDVFRFILILLGIFQTADLY